MTNWTELQTLDPQTIKSRADLVALAVALGIEMEQTGGKWSGLCPFHDDSSPSLDVFVGEDGAQRVGCFPCGWTGDAYDLIMRIRNVRFPDAVSILSTLVEDGTVGEPPEPSAPSAPLDFDAYASTAQATDRGGLLSLLFDRGIVAPASWVAEEFRVGVNEYGEVVIPHYAHSGTLSAIKVRGSSPGGEWTKRNLRGSRLDALYGAWRDQARERVVLVEGESDAWTVAYLVRNEPIDVLGLPAGVAATPRPEWIDRLRGRKVTLLFDADDAGRRGLRSWTEALTNFASDVLIATLPEGDDATSAGPETALEALHGAVSTSAHGSALTKFRSGFVRETSKGPVPVSDWTLEVLRRAVNETETVFEVRLSNGKMETLRSADFESAARITRWANALGLAWLGTTKDAQELLRYCQAESVFVPHVRATDVVGFHEGSFILPENSTSIGTRSIVYVPPVADVRLRDRVRINPGGWSPSIPTILANLHDPQIVTPLLGWLAAAPLRSTLPNFPVLAVVGGSGWGKTTLVGEMLRTFGFSTSPMTMTATTPHAIASLVASTNAIPVWVDEYRPGSRPETKERLDQAIRDAWDGASSVKGGLKANLQALTFLPSIAPIIVTGEDAFSETSHAERMVILPMPKIGRNPEALTALRNVKRDGFGFAYLAWIAESWRSGTIPAAPLEGGRMEQSRAIARWGFDLFVQFTREACHGLDLGVSYDEERAVREHHAMTDRPPILDALGTMIGRFGHDGRPVAWIEVDDVCVRPKDFVALYRKQFPDDLLPGGYRAVASWLAENFETERIRTRSDRYLRLKDAAKTL